MTDVSWRAKVPWPYDNGYAATLTRAHRHSESSLSLGQTPLIARHDNGGWFVSFATHLPKKDVDHVALCGPIVLSDIRSYQLSRVPGTDVWHITLLLPPKTRTAYNFTVNGSLASWDEVDDWKNHMSSWICDSRNPNRFEVPFNELTPETTPSCHSICATPDTTTPFWAVDRPDVPKGRVDRYVFRSRLLKDSRRLYAYTPRSIAKSDGCWLLVAFDGWRAVNVTHLPTVLDNLIHMGEIPPVCAVLIDSGRPEMRARDLTGSEEFNVFFTSEIVPWAAEKWAGRAFKPGTTIVTGMSAGGKAAAFAALRHPEVFGNAICQSAAVAFPSPGRAPGWLLDEYAAQPPSTTRFAVDVGLLEIDQIGDFESLLVANRHLSEILDAAGCPLRYSELACGHDEIVFGETVADDLQFILSR
jgi:enterochelin esterase-like enzyme